MNCRGAKEENKRSAVKNRRGKTISGSDTATSLNRMPAALLKQSKDFRFLTLRRRGRPFPEIASAAGWADACVFCGSSEPRSSPPPPRGGLLSHSDRRRRTARQKPKSATSRTTRAATSPQKTYASFHIFSFFKRKYDWNLYRKHTVSNANHRKMRLFRVVRAAASRQRRPAIRIRSFTRSPQAAARKHCNI